MGPDVPPRPLTGEPLRRRTAPASASPLREYAEVILVAVVFALFARTFLVQAFVVPTPSMEDTVLVGDHLVVNKFIYAPHARGFWTALLPYREIRRGDIFVFKFPEDPQRDFIKRAIALPGDTIEIRSRTVIVDGSAVREPKSIHSDPHVWPDDPHLPDSLRRRDQLPPSRVPSESYFAMGDNRDSSYDSRFWGPVPKGNLKGRALFVYWSFEPPAPDSRLGVFAKIASLWRRTRWSRTLLPVR
jgi:signal peptidase I